MTQHCVVIGRGLAGLSLARELQMSGCSVSVVARDNSEGDASRSAQGVSSVKGLLYGRGDLFRAKLEGHRFLLDWTQAVVRESGLDVPFSLTGAWEPIDSEESYRAIRERVYKQSWSGAFGLTTQPFPRQLFKTSDGGFFTHAFRHPYDGWVDVPRLLSALETTILKNGGEIVRSKVEKCEMQRPKGWRVVLEGKVLFCDELFLAAGWGVNRVTEDLGFRFKTKEIPGGTLQWRGLKAAQGVYLFGKRSFVSSHQGAWKFGSVDTKAWPTTAADQLSLMAALKTECGRHMSIGAEALHSASLNWGTRVCSHDLLPIVGSISFETGHRLFVSCAFHKSGLQLAPLAAKRMVAALRGEEIPSYWRSFEPGRKGLIRPI